MVTAKNQIKSTNRAHSLMLQYIFLKKKKFSMTYALISSLERLILQHLSWQKAQHMNRVDKQQYSYYKPFSLLSIM